MYSRKKCYLFNLQNKFQYKLIPTKQIYPKIVNINFYIAIQYFKTSYSLMNLFFFYNPNFNSTKSFRRFFSFEGYLVVFFNGVNQPFDMDEDAFL
jgi:hypothetical protein